MHITLIDGTNHQTTWQPYSETIRTLVTKLQTTHQVDHFVVKDMQLNYCTGCWDCWVKTPGLCRHQDDGDAYLKSLAHSDALLIFAPVIAGFISSEAKNALDRFIPSALPYVRIHEGECHHLARYKDPSIFGLYLLDDGHLEVEALTIIKGYVQRLQKNMKNEQLHCHPVKLEEMEALTHAISHY